MTAHATTQPRSAAASKGLTAALVDRVVSIRFDGLPNEIVELGKQCLLDWLAVTVAGASEPLVEILLDEVNAQGGSPQASLIGRSQRLTTQQAALINGASSHALDFDDVNPAMTGHPSAPIIPGLLALAEHRGSSGAEFLASFTAGYETACRIGSLVNPAHYERGFHATATLGCLGSAAACARLLGLDRDRTANALGIAATQAAGLKSMFGTMCKPFHAGKAAQNGLLAATLAARGFGSREDALECGQGFAAALGGDFDPGDALSDPPGGYHMSANLFKYHAACYLTHAAIECALRLREQHRLTPDSIGEVIVRVAEGCDSVCNIAEPRDGLGAKFSLRMTTAFALAGIDTASIGSYSEENCADPALIALRDKVRVELVPNFARMQSEVAVIMNDGSRIETAHDSGIPAEDLRAQKKRLLSKFHALVDPVLGKEQGRRLAARVGDLDGLPDLSDLVKSAQPV